MWVFFRMALLLLLLVFILFAVGYFFVQRWMVQKLDKALTGEDRDGPDIEINVINDEEKEDNDDEEDGWDDGYFSD